MSELKAVESDKVEVTPEQQEREASAAISAGYNRIKGEPVEAKPATEVVVEKLAAAEAKPAEETKPAEVIPDPWEGVSPVIKEQFGELGKRFDAVMHHLKSTDGRIGAVQKALASAKADTTKAGADAPTAQQIQSAVVTPEKWKKLEEDFPSWAEALSERLAADRAAITAEIKGAIPKPVDVEATIQPLLQAVKSEARALARIDFKHEGWEEKVKTPKFTEWLKVQAPEIQALADSDKADDAIRLLDQFDEHAKAAAVKAKQQARLATVVAPKQANSGGPSVLPDEAGLSVGYNRVKHA